MMPIDYDRLMAHSVQNVTQRYTQGDTILYALGIGMGADPLDQDQLRFVYERDLRVVPTQAFVLALPGAWLRESGIDYVRVVHGEQAGEFHAPIPAEGEVMASLRIADVIDKGEGRGALVFVERILTDLATGTKIATIRQTIFARGDGGVGGPTKVQPPAHALPDRSPDGTVALPSVLQQALIYRLSGDFNPLHADPVVAERAGFDRPILHGLATFGIATHALLKAACDYDPTRIATIAGRFTAPVFPGETFLTDYWLDDHVVSFRTRVQGRDAIAISNGRMTLR